MEVSRSARMTTVVLDDLEWDDEKEKRNINKHGVSFEEAASAVIDAHALVFKDDSQADEERFRIIGRSYRERVLFVVTVERGDRDRIVSARQATPKEERRYLTAR